VSKVIVIAEVPSFELVELMYRIPSTPLIAVSRIVVTADSTSLEFAPIKLLVTTTCGGASFGYREIGSVGIQTAPASTIRRAQTVAKIGRRIKKSTNKVTSGRGGWPTIETKDYAETNEIPQEQTKKQT
jgi:hypothetical protein